MKLTNETWKILEGEVFFRFARSRGPGGQSVNKTNSRALLYWPLPSSLALSHAQKVVAAEKLQNRCNEEGLLYLSCDEYRDQFSNKQACLSRLRSLLESALTLPKKRVATKPTRSSKKRRIEGKQIRSQVKSMRKKPQW